MLVCIREVPVLGRPWMNMPPIMHLREFVVYICIRSGRAFVFLQVVREAHVNISHSYGTS